MAKIRLTKNELKRQKDNLKRFTRYLPTLELKKQQLLVEIRRIQNTIDRLQEEMEQVTRQVSHWVDVFAEEIDLYPYIQIQEIRISEGNIAGIAIPIFKEVEFQARDYDYFKMPFWIDAAIPVICDRIRMQIAMQYAIQQQEIIREELRITIQRIKLFEEVKIPEAQKNIHVIQIFLGDQQTAEVVRGKIAKAKIQKKKTEMSPI